MCVFNVNYLTYRFIFTSDDTHDDNKSFPILEEVLSVVIFVFFLSLQVLRVADLALDLSQNFTISWM